MKTGLRQFQHRKLLLVLAFYDLFPDYRGMFLLENENNEEVIFDVQFQFPDITNDYHTFFQQGNVLKSLPDAYLMTDGEPIETSPLYDPANPYDNRDPRLNQTLITIGSTFNGELVTGDELFADLTGFAYKKYTYFVDDEVRTAPQPGQSEINPIVMRYAEVFTNIGRSRERAQWPHGSCIWRYQPSKGKVISGYASGSPWLVPRSIQGGSKTGKKGRVCR